jgi:hypothetical protein
MIRFKKREKKFIDNVGMSINFPFDIFLDIEIHHDEQTDITSFFLQNWLI